MHTLLLYFLFGVFFWVTGFYILYKAKDVAFYFLAAHFFIMGIGVITRTVSFGNLINDFPHIYGILMPLQFLYGPFYYFFLLWIFKKRTQFKLKDLLHLVPFIFNLIDFIPFYVMPGLSKIELFESKSVLSVLGITNEFYDLIKIVSYTFYLLMGVSFYFQYISSTKIENKKKTFLIHSWLRLDFILKLIAVFSTIIIGLIKKHNSFTISYYFYSADVFLNIFIIFKWPALLNGIQFTYVGNDVTPFKRLHFFINNFFRKIFNKRAGFAEFNITKQVVFSFKSNFKNRNFNSFKLAKLLHVNEEQLEKFCKREYDIDSDTFINFVRIVLITEIVSHSSKPLLKNIIYESGFDSIVRFENTLHLYQHHAPKLDLNIPPEINHQIRVLYKQQINGLFD